MINMNLYVTSIMSLFHTIDQRTTILFYFVRYLFINVSIVYSYIIQLLFPPATLSRCLSKNELLYYCMVTTAYSLILVMY